MTSRSTGFTLVELVVVMVVVSIISLITVTYVARMSDVYVTTSQQRDADAETLGAWTRIQREFRTMQALTAGATNSLTFTEVAGATNAIVLSGADLTMNGNYLARNVSQFSLNYYDSTNGPIATPVSAGNLALVKRIAAVFSVRKSGQSSTMNVNLFCPKTGTTR